MIRNTIFPLILPLLFIAACASVGPVGSTHEHASFKVYLDGKQLDLLKPKYMVKSQYVHIEGGDAETIHKHATRVTLGYFFKTLDMKFTKDCFITDENRHCNTNNKTLKFYANGIRDEGYGDHEIRDGESYLINYGNESEAEIQNQIKSISEPKD